MIFMKQVTNSDKATGQLQHAGRQKQGWNPLLPDAENLFSLRAGFSVRHLRCNCSPGTVARYLFPVPVSQGGAVLFAPPRKAVAFLTTLSVCQKHGTGISLPAAAIRATRPEPRQHFWKIAGSKNFLFLCSAQMTQPTFHSANILGSHSVLFHMKQCSWETVCVWFGKIALLFAFVLFAGDYVIRIIYESFLDFCFSEFFMLSEWRTAFTHFS